MKEFDAGRSGLILGLVSIVYMVITALMGKINASGAGAAVINVTEVILWAAKLYICIRLMKYFMKKYADGKADVTNRMTFRFGSLTALLSALLFSGFSLAWALFIQPDMYAEGFNAAMEMYEGMLTADQLDSMQELMPKLPTISFFANLVWCWLFGTVLAAIFSRNIPSRNPFGDIPESDNQ